MDVARPEAPSSAGRAASRRPDQLVPEPALSVRRLSQTHFDVGGEEVWAFSDGHFARVREKHAVPPDFLSTKQFSFRSLRLFGGKGGNLMAFTTDRRYLVKELSAVDHRSLSMHTVTIVERVLTGDSLIVPLFLHFARSSAGGAARHYVVMRNVLPALPTGLVFHKKYDLKGNRDDKLLEDEGDSIDEVHKRCFHCHTCWYGCDGWLPLCTTASRKRYLLGKAAAWSARFAVGAENAARIVGMLRGDSDTLCSLNLMDYSLMVGILRVPEGQPVPEAGGLQQFTVRRSGSTYVYYLGVIDFLQEWTLQKRAAMLIKLPFAPKPLSTVPPALYAHQFAVNLERKFLAADAEAGDGAEGPPVRVRV